MDTDNKIEKYYDQKTGNASHYEGIRLNTMIKYERIFGSLGLMMFCEISAEKYKDRLGKKDNQSPEQELLKIQWYERAAKYYFSKLGTDREIKIDNTRKYGLPWLSED